MCVWVSTEALTGRLFAKHSCWQSNSGNRKTVTQHYQPCWNTLQTSQNNLASSRTQACTHMHTQTLIKKSSKPHNGNLPQVQAVFLWGLFILLKTEHPEFTGEAKFVLHQLISTVHMNNTLKLCFIFSFFTNPHQYRWYVKVSISVLSHLLCFLVLKPEWKMPSLLYTLSGYKYIRLRYELPGVTANLFSGSAALLCAKLQFWQ